MLHHVITSEEQKKAAKNKQDKSDNCVLVCVNI